MLHAALPILKKGAEDPESFAKVEFTKIAYTIVAIGEQVAAGQINEQEAKRERSRISRVYGRVNSSSPLIC